MSNKIYTEIQTKIVKMLEDSLTLKYQKSWFSVGNMAKNPISNAFYTGFNQLYLSFIADDKNYSINKWLTFKQASELKGVIIKGEKATPVMYYNRVFKNEKGENIQPNEVQKLINSTGKTLAELKITSNGFLRFYFVFNVAQISGLPESFYKTDGTVLTDIEKIEVAEQILINSKANIKHKFIDEAYYMPSKDLIVLPDTSQFKNSLVYYSTAFHELSHWTGAAHRLNRVFGKFFKSKEYAFEELVAELSTALVCGSLSITKDFTNNTAYIKSWIAAFKNDVTIFFKAAAFAQKSADYILAFNQELKQVA